MINKLSVCGGCDGISGLLSLSFSLQISSKQIFFVVYRMFGGVGLGSDWVGRLPGIGISKGSLQARELRHTCLQIVNKTKPH